MNLVRVLQISLLAVGLTSFVGCAATDGDAADTVDKTEQATVVYNNFCADWGPSISLSTHIRSEISDGDYHWGFSKANWRFLSSRCSDHRDDDVPVEYELRMSLVKWNGSDFVYCNGRTVSETGFGRPSGKGLYVDWRESDVCGTGLYQTRTSTRVKIAGRWTDWVYVVSGTHRLPVN